jgi:hypothetical protein
MTDSLFHAIFIALALWFLHGMLTGHETWVCNMPEYGQETCKADFIATRDNDNAD